MKTLNTTLIITGVLGLGALSLGNQIVETVESGHYQIKQAAVSGTMSIHGTEGTYLQNFGTIHDYELTGVLISTPTVRFQDGSTADVQTTITYRLPVSDAERLKLHREYNSFNNVANGLVPSAVEGAMKQTANLFGAEEVYSTKRSEFVELFRDQLVEGLFQTRQGKDTNEVVRDKNGSGVIMKPSNITAYGLEIVNIEINDIDFDPATDKLITLRKKAEQEQTLAKAEAERSKQDAISAEEKGKANVAKAKYEALVKKEREVIEAEKKTAMAVEATKQAVEVATQTKAKGEADAYAAKLKVEAGLSPREAAEIERDTNIGMAEAWAKRPVPQIYIAGGTGEDSGAVDPLEVLAIESLKRQLNVRTPK